MFLESRRSLDPLPTRLFSITLRHPLANEIPSPDEKLQGQIPPPRARRMQAIRVTPLGGRHLVPPHRRDPHGLLARHARRVRVATRGHAARDIPTPTVFAPDARA